MRVLMATRESPEGMSRMFTENVCIDSCLGTVVTDAQIGRLQIGARYSTKSCVCA
jgi:hypothetical protein